VKNVFDDKDTQEIIGRINNLSQTTKGLWGKMTVSQMLAHCSVTYEFVYGNIHPPVSAIKKILLKLFVKPFVVGEKPYKKNTRTAPEFLIIDDKDFDKEKKRLIDYLIRTQELGEAHFDYKEYRSFGALSLSEWNNMFYKHLDHHLGQFGV
jgi:hypothetical protein